MSVSIQGMGIVCVHTMHTIYKKKKKQKSILHSFFNVPGEAATEEGSDVK